MFLYNKEWFYNDFNIAEEKHLNDTKDQFIPSGIKHYNHDKVRDIIKKEIYKNQNVW